MKKTIEVIPADIILLVEADAFGPCSLGFSFLFFAF